MPTDMSVRIMKRMMMMIAIASFFLTIFGGCLAADPWSGYSRLIWSELSSRRELAGWGRKAAKRCSIESRQIDVLDRGRFRIH